MDRDTYFDNYNPDLLSLIPPDAKAILEIGCGAGKLCEMYRKVNPEVEWVGIDRNWEALAIAESRGVEILDININVSLPVLLWEPHDVIVLGDVLEHLIDPWNVLKWCIAHLKPDGQVIASIPNVQHWTIVNALLHGAWVYEDDGLLDRTHLRFFTLQTIRDMFANAGLQVFEIRGRQLFNEGYGEFLDRSRLEHDKAMTVYQYIVRAVRSAEPVPKLHIHAVGDGTICERPRLHEPLAMLATIPGVRCSTHSAFRVSAPHPFPADEDAVLILQRERASKGIEHYLSGVRRLLADYPRCLLIAEIDDDPESLEGIPESDYLPLRAVHAVQVTTDVLAETCRKFNPNVAVFPNQIAELPPLKPPPDADAQIRIFFGALNREADWAPIMPALNRVLASFHESKVNIHVVHDVAFYKALKTDNKNFISFCDYITYRRILRGCDIALLPLEPNRFNRHKSDIKFLECAAEGVASLHGETVYGSERTVTYRDPGGFEDKLRWLIEDAEERQIIVANAYAYVRDRRLLGQHFRKRYEWYQDLLSRKLRLTHDLLERVPELRVHSDLAVPG